MAVTQSSDGYSKRPVEEGAEPCYGEGTDGLIKRRKSDGPSTGQRYINKDTGGVVKSYKIRRKWNNVNGSDSLSDIDDAEVSGYLNTKDEILFKRILWEAMNGSYAKAKKRKRTSEAKKGASVKKAEKSTEKVESQRRSSRINYDALKFLNDELDEGSETAQIISADSPNGNISHGMRGSSNEDQQHDVNSTEENETFGHDDSEIYSGYGDEHYDDEYFDF